MHTTQSGFSLAIFCVIAVMLGYIIGAPTCKYGSKLNSTGECVCPPFNHSTKDDGVCGSNGIEYRNECALKQAACIHQRRIFVFKKGMCGSSYSSPCSYIFCSLKCPLGLVQDSFGCYSRCECRAFECSSMSSCNRTCDGSGGVVLDNNDCPQCKCNESYVHIEKEI